MRYGDAGEKAIGAVCAFANTNRALFPGTPRSLKVALLQMEANIVESVSRLTLSSVASIQDDPSRLKRALDVSFSAEELEPSTLDDDADVIQTPMVSSNAFSPRRSFTRCHKRSSSFLETPVQLQSELFLPTPLISNKDQGHSFKKRRNNRDTVGRRVPLLPDSPILDDCEIPVIHRPCFSPFLRSSTVIDDVLARQDYKSNEGVVPGITVKDASDRRRECPSLAVSRSSSPFIENLPYLDPMLPSIDCTPRVRVLKMRTKSAYQYSHPSNDDFSHAQGNAICPPLFTLSPTARCFDTSNLSA